MSPRSPWCFRGQTDSSCRRLTSVFQTCLPSVHTALCVCMFSWCVLPSLLLITGVHSCRPAWRINSCRRRYNRHRPHKSDTGRTQIQMRQLRTHAQEPRRRRCYSNAIRLHTNVPLKMTLVCFNFWDGVLGTGGKRTFESLCDSCKLWFHCHYSHPSPGSLVKKDGTIEPPHPSQSNIQTHTHTCLESCQRSSARQPPPPPLPPIREGFSSSPLPVTWVISLCCFILAR